MSDEEHQTVLPVSRPLEDAYDIAAAVSSMVPWLGGPVSVVLSGIAVDLKIKRVGQVLTQVVNRIKHLESEASKEYVQTEEFRELLERTLRQVAHERSEKMRSIYAAFLAGDIESPGEPYNEKLRVLRILEELQADHIRILAAMMQKPEKVNNMSGSISRTLSKRLPSVPTEGIAELYTQLQDLKLASQGGLNTMMTAQGAEDLFNYITPLGRRFVTFILEGDK